MVPLTALFLYFAIRTSSPGVMHDPWFTPSPSKMHTIGRNSVYIDRPELASTYSVDSNGGWVVYVAQSSYQLKTNGDLYQNINSALGTYVVHGPWNAVVWLTQHFMCDLFDANVAIGFTMLEQSAAGDDKVWLFFNRSSKGNWDGNTITTNFGGNWDYKSVNKALGTVTANTPFIVHFRVATNGDKLCVGNITISCTDIPTADPSDTPSSPPTNAPSLTPTSPPSLAPTADPSDIPSSAPTLSPSNAPSSAPTLSPSNAPSLTPTSPPSSAPSLTPTSPPSLAPTAAPTLSPSNTPSSAPTLFPSDTPSSAPTLSPSNTPSSAPTLSPSNTPSSAPTDLHLVHLHQ
eukprot:761233_1